MHLLAWLVGWLVHSAIEGPRHAESMRSTRVAQPSLFVVLAGLSGCWQEVVGWENPTLASPRLRCRRGLFPRRRLDSHVQIEQHRGERKRIAAWQSAERAWEREGSAGSAGSHGLGVVLACRV